MHLSVVMNPAHDRWIPSYWLAVVCQSGTRCWRTDARAACCFGVSNSGEMWVTCWLKPGNSQPGCGSAGRGWAMTSRAQSAGRWISATRVSGRTGSFHRVIGPVSYS